MANEIKMAKAAQEIAHELAALPEGSPYPFGGGVVFKGGALKIPCCVIGHVIARAGLKDLVQGRSMGPIIAAGHTFDESVVFVSSHDAVTNVCGTFDRRHVHDVLENVVNANDRGDPASAVAVKLFKFADELEEEAYRHDDDDNETGED